MEPRGQAAGPRQAERGRTAARTASRSSKAPAPAERRQPVAEVPVLQAQVPAGQATRVMPPARAKGAWPPAPRALLEAARALAPAARALARAAEASPWAARARARAAEASPWAARALPRAALAGCSLTEAPCVGPRVRCPTRPYRKATTPASPAPSGVPAATRQALEARAWPKANDPKRASRARWAGRTARRRSWSAPVAASTPATLGSALLALRRSAPPPLASRAQPERAGWWQQAAGP
jgi:hypothetical protein